MYMWSPDSVSPAGPIWNSHWPGMTSALMPEILSPALMHAVMCSSTISRPNTYSAPTPQ